MSIDKGTITGHLISHWGVPKSIHPMRVNNIGEIAILEFAPRGPRKTWRYATNGMSSKNQVADDQIDVRTELFACSVNHAPWIEKLLITLAQYPFLNQTYFSEFDSIDAGQPIDQNASSYTGIFLTPPTPNDSQSLGLIRDLQGEVLIHKVVGLLPNEVEFVASGGGEDLWNSFFVNIDTYLDCKRK